MGIKNLMVIIKRFSPNSISNKKINDYKNKILAIDANLMIYKMIFAIRKNGYDLKNDNTIVTHIYSLMLKLLGFVKYNITPIFVFDGMPPKIKEETLKKRDKFKEIMQQKYYKAVTQDEKKKYYFMKSNISYEEILDCKELIDIFGFTWIDSPEEADSQLAELSKKNKIDYIVTDDLDILIFGGKKILKNFTIAEKKKMQEIDLSVLLNELNFTQSQLIDLGILLGCDYCPATKGIGTIGAYNLMKTFGSIDDIVKRKMKLPFDYESAQIYFKNPQVINSKNVTIKQVNIDIKKLKSFLKKFNFKKKYVNNVMDKIK